jgi:hypothetical protein
MQLRRIQTKDKTVFFYLTRLTNKIFLHTSTQCVRPSKIFRISYPVFSLWSSEKRPVQNTQSASCSSSSSVESSSRGTASSVSQSDGVSDGVGSRQTLIFLLFEGPRTAFDSSRQVLDLVTCLTFFSELPQNTFYNVNSLFSLLFQHEDLDLIQAWNRDDMWWSDSLSRTERRIIRRTEWQLIAVLHQSRMVHTSSICVPWRQG